MVFIYFFGGYLRVFEGKETNTNIKNKIKLAQIDKTMKHTHTHTQTHTQTHTNCKKQKTHAMQKTNTHTVDVEALV